MVALLSPLLLAASLTATAAAAVTVGSKGCGHNLKTRLTPGGPSRFFNFDSNAARDKTVSLKRRVRIALPEKYAPDTPAPVIISFHARYRNATSFEAMTQFSNSMLNQDAITVFPESVDSINLFWTGDPFAVPMKNDDRIFTGELLDQLQDNFCVDRARVYVTGMDNGGGLCHLLACNPAMSQRIAAVALAHPNIYTDEAMTQKEACMQKLFQPHRCKPARPVPILHIQSTTNQISSYVGDSFLGKTVPAPDVVAFWVEKNGCDVSKGNTSTSMTEGRVTKYTYHCGPDDKPLVMHYALHEGEHDWPYVAALEGRADSHGWDGTQAILDFFRLHRLPNDVIVDMATADAAEDAKVSGDDKDVKDSSSSAATAPAEDASAGGADKQGASSTSEAQDDSTTPTLTAKESSTAAKESDAAATGTATGRTDRDEL